MNGSSDDNVLTVSTSGVLAGATSLSYEAELILNAIPGGVLGLDLAGCTTLVNDAAVRLLGWSAAELIGRPLHDLIHHHHADGSEYAAAECPIQRTLATGEVHQSSSDVFWRRDGTSIPVEFDSRPILRVGERVGALVASRDRSERDRAEERTRQMVREQFARAKAELQHAQLREILVQAPALICVTRGSRHVIDTVNELFQRALDHREVAGTPVADAFPALPPE